MQKKREVVSFNLISKNQSKERVVSRYLIGLMLCIFVMTAQSESSVKGVDHLGLSVSNLNASEIFFMEYAGFKVFSRDDSYPATFLNNGSVIITLWRVKNPKTAIKFNRKNNIGLHHVAFSVASFKALDKLYEKLKADKSVIIEFAPELLGKGPAKHMMVYEPSGNRVEFIH